MKKRNKNIEFIDETQERKELRRLGTIKGLLAGSLLTRENVIKQLPFILFLAGLAFFYIGNRYHAENLVRENSELQKEVKELRAKAISTSAENAKKSPEKCSIRAMSHTFRTGRS